MLSAWQDDHSNIFTLRRHNQEHIRRHCKSQENYFQYEKKFAKKFQLIKVAEGHARFSDVTLASRGEHLTAEEMEDLTFHLGRMQLQPPLEAWHLPLWLTKTPLPDQAVLQKMVSSVGAQQLSPEDVESQLGTRLELEGSQEKLYDVPIVASILPDEKGETCATVTTDEAVRMPDNITSPTAATESGAVESEKSDGRRVRVGPDRYGTPEQC